jgi:hypothetical protein
MREVPGPCLSVQRQVGLLHISSLQGSALDRPICDAPLQSVGSGDDREVGEADLEGVAGRYRRTAYSSINNTSCKL